tara:strand:- start:320 stop:1498 length:1179 start_codon:yes stop_codon:yes gene_type:complete
MKLIYFVESYVAGGSDKVANILLNNLNINNIQLLLNKRADKKIILNTNKKINVKLYSLITPAEIHEKVNKFKGNNLVYFTLKIISIFLVYPLIFYSIIYFYFILRTTKATHFFSHNGGHPGGIYNGTSLMAASLIPSIKYKFYAFHSNPIKYRNYLFLFDFFWDKIIEKISNIITISKAASLRLVELRFFNKAPIVIHNGSIRRRLKNFNSSIELRILHIGYFDRNKNQILLLKSLSKLISKNFHNIHLTFIGKTVDKKARNDFDKFLKNHNLSKYVKVEGFINNVIPYYYNNDLLICSSFVEGFPLSILEAMSIGLPIISTDVGGVNEQIKNGKNGFLVESNNSNDLAIKIQYFYRNRDSIEKMGKESHQIFNDKFGVDKMIHNYNSLFGF